MTRIKRAIVATLYAIADVIGKLAWVIEHSGEDGRAI